MESHKTPLKIYVCWDSQFTDGRVYAESIFSEFSRKHDDYVGESLCIPVYFITDPKNSGIQYIDTAEYNAFVLLIDNKMVLSKDWQLWVDLLIEQTKLNGHVKLYPVAACDIKGAVKLSRKIEKINFIELLKTPSVPDDNANRIKKASEYLNFELVHELARLLYNRKRVSEKEDGVCAAIKIFVSYARQDGKDYAEIFNEFITANTALDRFIDVHNIPAGETFDKVIDRSIEETALMIICSDAYSSREWCQHELLVAKNKGRPILIVDAIENGELRRFPYIANVKTIHLGHGIIGDDRKREIVYAILLETLKVKYNEMFFRYLTQLYDIDQSRFLFFAYPPELYTLLKNKDNDAIDTILYPEPPLNKHEIEILNEYNKKYKYVTPTYIAVESNQIGAADLSGVRVGISISEISQEGDIIKTNLHLCKFYVELCRYLLASNVQLVYGGNVYFKGQTNFVRLLLDLAHSYCADDETKESIKIFYPSTEVIDDKDRIDARPAIDYHAIDVGSTPPENVLTRFREKINEELDVRIAVGGKIEQHSGRMLGVIEEAIVALRQKKPVFVIGSYGGAAELLSDCLEGKNCNLLNDEEIKFLNSCGIAGLNNGLSEEENKTLIHCDSSPQMIALILSGLSRRFGKDAG